MVVIVVCLFVFDCGVGDWQVTRERRASQTQAKIHLVTLYGRDELAKVG